MYLIWNGHSTVNRQSHQQKILEKIQSIVIMIMMIFLISKHSFSNGGVCVAVSAFFIN